VAFKIRQNAFPAGALPQTALGKLTMLPLPLVGASIFPLWHSLVGASIFWRGYCSSKYFLSQNRAYKKTGNDAVIANFRQIMRVRQLLVILVFNGWK